MVRDEGGGNGNGSCELRRVEVPQWKCKRGRLEGTQCIIENAVIPDVACPADFIVEQVSRDCAKPFLLCNKKDFTFEHPRRLRVYVQGKCQRWHRSPPTFSCPAGWSLVSETSSSINKNQKAPASEKAGSSSKRAPRGLSEEASELRKSSANGETVSAQAAICVFEEEAPGTLACASGFSLEQGACVKRTPEQPEGVCGEGFSFSPGRRGGVGECRQVVMEDSKPVCREGLYFHPAVGKCIYEEEPSFECPSGGGKRGSASDGKCGRVLVEPPKLRCPRDTAPLVVQKKEPRSDFMQTPSALPWFDFPSLGPTEDPALRRQPPPKTPPPISSPVSSSVSSPTSPPNASSTAPLQPSAAQPPHRTAGDFKVGWQHRSWSSASRSLAEASEWRRLFEREFLQPPPTTSAFGGAASAAAEAASSSREFVCERLEVSENARYLRCPEGFQAEMRSDSASSVCVRRLQKLAKADCRRGPSTLQNDGLCADVSRPCLSPSQTWRLFGRSSETDPRLCVFVDWQLEVLDGLPLCPRDSGAVYDSSRKVCVSASVVPASPFCNAAVSPPESDAPFAKGGGGTEGQASDPSSSGAFTFDAMTGTCVSVLRIEPSWTCPEGFTLKGAAPVDPRSVLNGKATAADAKKGSGVHPDALCERREFSALQVVCPIGYSTQRDKKGRAGVCTAEKEVPGASVCEPVGFALEGLVSSSDERRLDCDVPVC